MPILFDMANRLSLKAVRLLSVAVDFANTIVTVVPVVFVIVRLSWLGGCNVEDSRHVYLTGQVS